jgi:microcystin degradation protein MlrC
VERAIGGRLDPSAGAPVGLRGRVLAACDWAGTEPARQWVTIGFGEGCAVVLTAFLTQVMEPATLPRFGIDPAAYDVFAIKSRVHFRCGFDDSGFAPTILLVEPDEPFLGTVRLEALPYRHLDIGRFYPYGAVSFP